MSRIFNFEINDRVMMIENNAVRKGVIAQVFENVPTVVIVKFDDGEVEKVNPQRLAIEPIPEVKDEPKTEPEKERIITISEDEFARKAAELITHEMMRKDAPPEVGMLFTMFSAKMMKKLFVETDSNA